MSDVEAELITFLRDHPDLSGYADRIGVTYSGAAPWITIERIGGVAEWLAVVDHPRIDVTVWHTDRGAAHDLAQVVRRILHQDLAGRVGDHVAFGGTTEFMGLRFVVDELTEVPRFMFSVEITVRYQP